MRFALILYVDPDTISNWEGMDHVLSRKHWKKIHWFLRFAYAGLQVTNHWRSVSRGVLISNNVVRQTQPLTQWSKVINGRISEFWWVCPSEDLVEVYHLSFCLVPNRLLVCCILVALFAITYAPRHAAHPGSNMGSNKHLRQKRYNCPCFDPTEEMEQIAL